MCSEFFLNNKSEKNRNTHILSYFSDKLFVYQCHLLITLANSLDPDQAQQIVGPDQGPN